MSLNRFMHPKNIYRTKPDFAQMAANYPSFRPFVRLDLNGKLNIDFNDSNALRQLTTCLLKKDFDLDVEIPADRLIPTVPQRLNYILWVEDLLSELIQLTGFQNEQVFGLDIGTGSSAVFPLIGSVINKNWSFVATDIDDLNIENARNNVIRNNLNQRIKVIRIEDQTYFNRALEEIKPKTFHFSMTNPPFFSDNFGDSDNCDNKSQTQVNIDSDMEAKRKLKLSSRKKSAANTSAINEAVYEGGEVGFVSKMIEQSLEVKQNVMIYTAMLGKKISYLQLKDIIKSYIEKGLITSFVSTEFCQGMTKRWGIAWTFIDGLDLKGVPTIKCVKPKPPLVYFIPPLMKESKYDLNSISERIKFLLVNDLIITSFGVTVHKKSVEFDIKSNTNTWSHQRRKKREQKAKNSPNTSEVLDVSESESNIEFNEIDLLKTENQNLKRRIDKEINSDQNLGDLEIKRSKTIKDCFENQLYLLHCYLKIKREKQSIYIELKSGESAQNSESTYQLFQYFKNKLI